MYDDGPVHYRVTGGRLSVRSAGDRRLRASVLVWGKPVRLSTGSLEWFTRDREPPLKAAELVVKHYGRRAGQVTEWRSGPLGLDAVLTVDQTMIGDGLLGLIDKYGQLPLSPAFLGDGIRHSDGIQWRNLSISELAVVPEQELPWAWLRRLSA